MKAALLAVLLVPAAARAQTDGLISDPGDPLGRSTGTLSVEAAPAEAEPDAPTPAPAPAPGEPAEAPAHAELRDAAASPGRLLRGRGGDPYPSRRGGAVLLDAEGRRLEIWPSSSRFAASSEPGAGRADRWSRPLRALGAAGAALALLLTAWLWRRRGA